MTAADRVSILRGVLVIVGALFQSDTIPTGVPGLGQKIGTGLLALGVSLAAGDKTPDVLKQATVQGDALPAVQGFVSTPGRENNALQLLIRVAIAALAGIAG